MTDERKEFAELLAASVMRLCENAVAITAVLFSLKELGNDRFDITDLNRKEIDERISARLALYKTQPPVTALVRIVEEETNAECMKLLAESRRA